MDYHWKYVSEEQAKKLGAEDYILLADMDKQVVRDNLLHCVYLVHDPKILKQYVRCLTVISRFDYPL